MLAPMQAMLLSIAGIISIMTYGVDGKCVVGNTELRETNLLDSSGQYLDLGHPAPCNGNVTRWNFCYYASDIDQTATYVVLFRIWRMIDDSTYERIHEYQLNTTIEQSNTINQTLICENVTLSAPLEIHRNDILGVYIPFTSSLGGPPLHVIARDTTDVGLAEDTRIGFSVFTSDTISTDDLEQVTTLGLHLYADIEAEVMQSLPVPLTASQLQLDPTQTYVAPTLREPTSSTLASVKFSQPQFEFTTTTKTVPSLRASTLLPSVTNLLTSFNTIATENEMLPTQTAPQTISELGLTTSVTDFPASSIVMLPTTKLVSTAKSESQAFVTTKFGSTAATESPTIQTTMQPISNSGTSTLSSATVSIKDTLKNSAIVDPQSTPLATMRVQNTSSTLGIGVLVAIIATSVVAALVFLCTLLVLLVIFHKKQKRKKANQLRSTTCITNGTFYLDNVVYAGVLSDELSLKPDEESPIGSGMHVTPEQSVSSTSILQQNGVVPTVTDQSDAQDYETPICTSISVNSGEFLDSIANPHTAGHESQYISMESDSQILQQYSLSRKNEDKQGNARNRSIQSATVSELYSALNAESSEYYKLLEQATEGTDESMGQYYAPPSNQQEILSALSKQRIDMIPRTEIHTTTHLGSGQFGSVEKAIWKSINRVAVVAVKTISAEAIEVDKVRFLQEAAIMGQFRHPNVVRLNGVSIEQNTLMLVLEYLPKGDLRKCLVKMGRGILQQDTPETLLSYSQQVGLGMHYLSSKDFVHRDLAARNIFVTEENICKVGDFGMSRDLAAAEYYVSHGGKIPVRWTAPEAMYYRKYSTASDVWSYGCLLYEIWSLGRMPFKNNTNAEVIEKVDSGYRLPPPPGCPRIIYDLMIKCWHPFPSARPTSKDVLLTLLQNQSEVLHIPVRDASTNVQASILGAAISAGNYMYPDLQKTYTTISEKNDYDHITERKYILSFPTSSADIDSMYNDSAEHQSYRWTLLTSDTESDYEDI